MSVQTHRPIGGQCLKLRKALPLFQSLSLPKNGLKLFRVGVMRGKFVGLPDIQGINLLPNHGQFGLIGADAGNFSE